MHVRHCTAGADDAFAQDGSEIFRGEHFRDHRVGDSCTVRIGSQSLKRFYGPITSQFLKIGGNEWAVKIGGSRSRTGSTFNRGEAVVLAERAIDRALRGKRAPERESVAER